jgi:two-component sensor histidine kinase
MRYSIFFILFFLIQISFSQQIDIDSLKTLIEENNNEAEKIKVYQILTDELIKQKSADENVIFIEDYFELLKKKKDYPKLHKVSINLAEIFMAKNDSAKSYKYCQESINASNKTNNISDILLSSNQTGRVYDHFRNYDEAIKYYNQGLDYLTNTNSKDTLRIVPQLYFNISNSYYSKNKTDKALELIMKGVDYAYTINDRSSVSSGYYFLAWRYMYLGNYKKADEYFLKSLNEAKLDSNQTYMNRVYHGLGINYSRLGNYKDAIHYDSLALNAYKDLGNKVIVFDILNNMTVAYSKMGDIENTILTAKEALKDSDDINKVYKNAIKQSLIKSYILNSRYDLAEKYLNEVLKDTLNPQNLNLDLKISSFELYSNLMEKRGNYKDGLKYYKQHKKLSDSIAVDKRESNFADIETKYQTEKKEKENIQLKAENAEQALLTQKANTQKWLFAISAIAIGFIAFLLWRRYKSEVRSKRTIQEQKETIEILQKDLHHRVKNNLSVIDAFIEELKDDISDVGLSTKLSELQNRVLSINEVHAQLYKSTDITNIDVKKYVNSIAMNVASTFNRPEIRVEEKVSDNLKLNPSKSSLMGLIINEFITNSFKYAFDEEGEIVIQIDDKENEIDMTLSDNGKGLSEDFNLEKVTSYGFRIMKLLTLQLEGTFDFKSDNGLKLHIEFPKI